MLKNKNIRYNTDTTGFFVITIRIPDIVDKKLIRYKKLKLNPQNKSEI